MRMVDQLRNLLNVTDRFGELIDDARRGFERAAEIRNAKLVRNPLMAEKMIRASAVGAARACTGWTRCYADAERRIGETFKGLDALLADLGIPAARQVAAHLARVQPAAVAFPGYSPYAWEMETARNLAFRCLFTIRKFIDANPSEPGPDEPEEIEGAINLRRGLLFDLMVILHGRDDLDRLEAAIAADLAELNAAADAVAFAGPQNDIEPRRFAELVREAETLRANLIEAGAVYPDGGVHYESENGISVSMFGMPPAGMARLQAIAEHLEPVLRSLGADIGERGETADGRLLRWAVEMIDRSGDEQDRGNPFGLLATAVSRFVGRIAEPVNEPKPADSRWSIARTKTEWRRWIGGQMPDYKRKKSPEVPAMTFNGWLGKKLARHPGDTEKRFRLSLDSLAATCPGYWDDDAK